MNFPIGKLTKYIYIIYKKSHTLNEIILFGFSYIFLSYIFLLDGSIFTSDEEKEGKINSSTIFEGCYLSLRKKKKFEIHKLSQFSIT